MVQLRRKVCAMMQAMGVSRTSISVGSLSGGAPFTAIEVTVDTGSDYN
jgi:hypothetical protein